MEHALEYTPMGFFSQNAENKVTDLCNQMEETQKKFAELLEYFGEDEKMTSTDFFGTLNRFTESFKVAKDYVEHQTKMKLQEEKRAAARKIKDAKSAVKNPIDTRQSFLSKPLNLLVKPIAKRGIAHFMAKANFNTKPQKVLSESELPSDYCITNNNGNLMVEVDKPVADLIEIADEKDAGAISTNFDSPKPVNASNSSSKLKRELRRLNTSYNPTLTERNIDEGYVDDTFKQKVQIVNEGNESEIDNKEEYIDPIEFESGLEGEFVRLFYKFNSPQNLSMLQMDNMIFCLTFLQRIGETPRVGMAIEICDPDNIWSSAIIVKVDNDRKKLPTNVTIRYDGWGPEWDEVLPWHNFQRLAKIFTLTKRFKCMVNLKNFTTSRKGTCTLWPCIVNFRIPNPYAASPNLKKAENFLRTEPNIVVQPYGWDTGLLPDCVRLLKSMSNNIEGMWMHSSRVKRWRDDLKEKNKPPVLENFAKAYKIGLKDQSVHNTLPSRAFDKGSLLNAQYQEKLPNVSHYNKSS